METGISKDKALKTHQLRQNIRNHLLFSKINKFGHTSRRSWQHFKSEKIQEITKQARQTLISSLAVGVYRHYIRYMQMCRHAFTQTQTDRDLEVL